VDFTDNLNAPPKVPAWLVANLISQHLTNQNVNESNPGLGVEVPLGGDVNAMGGFYKNTQGRNSIYGGLEYMPIAMGALKAGMGLGAASGYENKLNWPVLPIATLKAAYETPEYGVNLNAIPNPLDWKRSAVGLQFKKPFK
jgi:hypothetical protein